MDIQENVRLSEHTTFRIGGLARYFISVGSQVELSEALRLAKRNKLSIFILGGGSNLLVSDNGFQGLVIQIVIKGIDIVSEDQENVEFKVGAGENWDEFVAMAVSKNLWGIENLSNIPGSVGAIPVQNVGAYGQEASSVITNVEVFDLINNTSKSFTNEECGFEYRSSNFNKIWKDQFVILSVGLRFSKKQAPSIIYPDVKNYFAQNPNPSILEIRNAIIEIRKNKFPDLNAVGTAGSFFKNVFLTPAQYESLMPEVRAMLSQIKDKFPQKENIKIPTAFLIDQLGFKGKQVGDAKLSEKHALVIVNEGTARASDVAELFKQVRQTVFKKTGIEILPEPVFLGFSSDELNEYFKLNE